MLSAEGIGKNIEQAIENALFELKAPREDVDIKILSEGGLFKKAKVLVTISEDAKEKYLPKTAPKEEKQEKEKEKEEKKEVKTQKKEEKKEVKAEKKAEKAQEKASDSDEEDEDDKDEDDQLVEGMDPVEFLSGLFKAAGKNVEVKVKNEDEKYITYSVEGEDLGDMIGHRGEGYYAIGRILTAVAGKTEKRILLDVGGYREKRA